MKYIPVLLLGLSLIACESSEEKALKTFVASQFRDPQSTQFEKITYKDGVMCGEVNSKNEYGAYVGYKRFVAIKKGSNPKSEYSYVESLNIFGEGNNAAITRSNQLLITMKVKSYLLQRQADLFRARANLPLLYKNSMPTELLGHTAVIQSFEGKAKDTSSEGELETLATEISQVISFENIFKSSCPSS